MSKRKRVHIDDEDNEIQMHKKQKLDQDEEKIPDVDQLTFFSKKIYSTKNNKTIETRYVVYDNITYRAKYTQNEKLDYRNSETIGIDHCQMEAIEYIWQNTLQSQ